MKEVTVHSWCDGFAEPHPTSHSGQPQVPAVAERTLVIDGAELVFDFCDDCDLLAKRLAERGSAPVGRRKPGPKPGTKMPRMPSIDPSDENMRTCQEPDCIDTRTGRQYVAPTRSALGQHVKQKHSKLLADYDWTQ